LFKKPNDDHHSNPMTETNCDDEVNQLNKEWAIVVLRQLSNFSAITWGEIEEHVNCQWDDDEVHFVLD
jgi:hypothetical protein